MSKLFKQRYEYYKGTTKIIDNEFNEFVLDIVDRLNTQHYNKTKLIEAKQLLEEKVEQQELEIQRLNEQVSNLVNVTGHYYREEITILQKALEIACADICSKYFDSERQDEIILHYVNNFKDKAKKELIK